MSTSAAEAFRMPTIRALAFVRDDLVVHLDDGRTLHVPLAWYPRLAGATLKQRRRFEITPSGYGIHWPDLDEDLSVYGFLYAPAPLPTAKQASRTKAKAR